jgi:hypothetical protein
MTESQALVQNLLITRAIMFTTILVAITSIVFSAITMAFERSHNVKSLRPFVNVIQFFTPNSISLSIDNAGLGPMLIERITLFPKNMSSAEGKVLAEILPNEIVAVTFFDCLDVYTLAAQNKLNILDYHADKQEIPTLSKLVEQLNGYSLLIEYRDVYDHDYKKIYPILLSS